MRIGVFVLLLVTATFTTSCQFVTGLFPVAVTGISLNRTSWSPPYVNATVLLRVKLTPSNTTQTGVRWTSSDTAVFVDSNGLVALTGASPTSAPVTVTATTENPDISAECSVDLSGLGL